VRRLNNGIISFQITQAGYDECDLRFAAALRYRYSEMDTR
jgi:hypothetical protein